VRYFHTQPGLDGSIPLIMLAVGYVCGNQVAIPPSATEVEQRALYNGELADNRKFSSMVKLGHWLDYLLIPFIIVVCGAGVVSTIMQ